MGAAAVPLLIASTVVSAGAGIIGSEEQKSALEARENQNHLAATQKKIKDDDRLERVLSTNRARAAAGPFATSSASFSALGEEDFNQFAEDRHAENLNLQFQDNAIDTEIDNTTSKEFIGVASNIIDAGQAYYKINSLSSSVSGAGSNGEPGERVEQEDMDMDPRRYEDF